MRPRLLGVRQSPGNGAPEPSPPAPKLPLEGAPRRLTESATQAGALLRQLPPVEPGRPPASFAALLSARRKRDRARALGWVLGTAMVALALMTASNLRQPRPGFPIVAEPLVVSDAALEQAPPLGEGSPSTPEDPLTRRPPPRPGKAVASPRVLEHDPATARTSPPSTTQEDPPPAPSRTPNHTAAAERDASKNQSAALGTQPATRLAAGASPVSGVGASDCAELARRGALTEAGDCYERSARGTGAGAELALIEHARLQIRAYSDRRQALTLLEAYFARFPRGALFPEAKLMQLNLLARQGESLGLLAELEAVLESGMLTERRGELQGLRAETLAKLGRCREAREALEAADSPTRDLSTSRRARDLCVEGASLPF